MAANLNWGIMTPGWIARKFATDLRQSRTGRLTAVGARKLADAEKFAREFGGARAHGSYPALLADPGVQAVYIGTPHPMHKEWALKAIAPAKPGLSEKPPTPNLAATASATGPARARGRLPLLAQ